MICSVRELGHRRRPRRHPGARRRTPAKPGDDALDVLGLRDAVLDIAVTSDRGVLPVDARPGPRGGGRARRRVPRRRRDGDRAARRRWRLPGARSTIRPAATGSPRARSPVSTRHAPTPDWMARRLRQCGMRSISLAVDVTNYVMLETGPAAARLRPRQADRPDRRAPGASRARQLTTLDGVDAHARPRRPASSPTTAGAIALAGVMGGASTEIGPRPRDVVLEAAHWDPASISRAVRRHKLPSEAAKRFERGVDPEIAAVALQRCVDLLVEHGGASAGPGFTVVGDGPPPAPIALRSRLPGRRWPACPSQADVVRRSWQPSAARSSTGTEPCSRSPRRPGVPT